MNRTKKIAIAVALVSTGSFMLAEPWIFPEEISEPIQEIVPERIIEPSPIPSVEPSSIEPTPPTEGITATEPPSPSVQETPTEENSPEAENIVISNYVDCTGNPQPCIDAGSLTYYSGNWSNGEWSQLIAGHDYMGFEYLNSIPTGTIVEVQGGAADGTYRVYDHLSLGRQGGDMPRFNGADLVLQSCQGSGTAFSLLEEL